MDIGCFFPVDKGSLYICSCERTYKYCPSMIVVFLLGRTMVVDGSMSRCLACREEVRGRLSGGTYFMFSFFVLNYLSFKNNLRLFINVIAREYGIKSIRILKFPNNYCVECNSRRDNRSIYNTNTIALNWSIIVTLLLVKSWILVYYFYLYCKISKLTYCIFTVAQYVHLK